MNTKTFILITVFLSLVRAQDLAQAFAQLSEADPQRQKLNWPTLSSAVRDLLADVQQARSVEDDTNAQKSALLQKLIVLHDRTANKIKVDIAKHNGKLTDQLLPYKNELDEGLRYRASILEQQKQALYNNDIDYRNMKQSAKEEMNEVSDAIQSIDQMRKAVKECLQVQGSSFLEIQSSVQQFHQQMTHISDRHAEGNPFVTLLGSLKELLQLDFKDRQVLKNLESLLDQFWMITIDYRIEMVSQANRNQQLFEDRRQAVLADKETTIDLYNSKIEAYNQVQDEINNIQTYVDNRKVDLENSAQSQDFFKNIWGLSEGVATNVKTQLTSKAKAIQDALKQLGDGVSFQER